jgi:hypothetical protein
VPEIEIDSWERWAKHVLHELERLDQSVECTKKSMIKIRIEIASLNVKAGIWGLIGASIPISMLLIAYFLRN